MTWKLEFKVLLWKSKTKNKCRKSHTSLEEIITLTWCGTAPFTPLVCSLYIFAYGFRPPLWLMKKDPLALTKFKQLNFFSTAGVAAHFWNQAEGNKGEGNEWQRGQGLPLRRDFPSPSGRPCRGRGVARLDSRRSRTRRRPCFTLCLPSRGSRAGPTAVPGGSSQLSLHRALLPAPPGLAEAGDRVPAAAPALSGSGGQALPARAARAAAPGTGAGEHRPRTSRRNGGDGWALRGWPVFQSPLRFCRALLCINMLKHRVVLEEAWCLEGKAFISTAL